MAQDNSLGFAIFDTPMDAFTASTFSVKQGTAAVAGTLAASADGMSVIFAPAAALSPNTVYTATIALGSLATIFTLIRVLSIPDTFFDTANRGIGIFISLVAAVVLIIAGLLRAAEEL